MSKLQERENKRRSIIGSMVEDTVAEPAAEPAGRGRPKEARELKKRISLSVLPSLYEDIQKIAYVQRKNASEIVSELMEKYRVEHEKELREYEDIR